MRRVALLLLVALGFCSTASAQWVSPGERARPQSRGPISVAGAVNSKGPGAAVELNGVPLQLNLGAGLTSALGTCGGTAAVTGTGIPTIYPQVCPVVYTSAHTVLSSEMGGLLVANSGSSFAFTLPAVGTSGFQTGQTVCFAAAGTGGFTLTSASTINSGPTTYGEYGQGCATSDVTNSAWHVVGNAGGPLTLAYLLGPELAVSGGQLDIAAAGVTSSMLASGAAAGNLASNSVALSKLAQVVSKAVLGNATGSTANVTAAWSVSNTTDTVIPLIHSATTAGHCAQFTDTVGTETDSGGTCGGGGGGSTTVISGTDVTVSSSPCTTSCTVAVATQGSVTAGTYSNPTVTVDASGITTAISNGSNTGNPALFCNGSQGPLISGFGSITLSADSCYSSVTWGSSDHIYTNGWRFFSQACDMSSAGANALAFLPAASMAGNAASTYTGGAVLASVEHTAGGTEGTGQSGSTATTGVGGVGAGPILSGFYYGGVGGLSGAGGAGTDAGGGQGTLTNSAALSPTLMSEISLAQYNSGSLTAIRGGGVGAGAASGGGDGTNKGGGGGGNGMGSGTVQAYCGTLATGTNSTASIISVAGGVGGAGGNSTAGVTGGGAGAGGGGGGHLFFVIGSRTGSTVTNGINLSGGNGGAGGAGFGTAGHGGTGGSSGTAGGSEIINLGAGTYTPTAPSGTTVAGSAGSTGGTDTGGAGGTAPTVQANL